MLGHALDSPCSRGVNRDGRHTPERTRCARVQTSRPHAIGTESPQWLELPDKFPQYPLSLAAIPFRMCGATVYEKSRL